MTIRDLAIIIAQEKIKGKNIASHSSESAKMVLEEEKNLRKCYISKGNKLFVAVEVDDKIL